MKKTTKKKENSPFSIAGVKIRPGERKRVFLETAALFDYTQLKMPVEVIRGTSDGPKMFICAAIHGDEINGVEIIRRILKSPQIKKVRGTLILIPVVNIFGFNNKSRYLPDRRDLNRSFPGKASGSLAGQMAHLLMSQVVSKCDVGIDLHTGAINRTNLPQIRACLDDPKTRELAVGFGVPVTLDSTLRDGSLREAARRKRVAMLLFEGGEALRFNEKTIKIGVRGCFSVMRKIGMLPALKSSNGARKENGVYVAKSSFWLRAPHSGIVHTLKKLGDKVDKGEKLAVISNLLGEEEFTVTSEKPGILIGMSTIPLVNRGEALLHIATFESLGRVRKALDDFDMSH